MDVLRSCYTVNAHFKAGDSRVSPMVWYWAPPGAQLFPGRHVFGSNNWNTKEGIPTYPVGEITGDPRPWRDGSPPFPTVGTNFCGREEWYRDGIPAFLGTDRPTRDNDSPVCCAPTATCQPFIVGVVPRAVTPDFNRLADSSSFGGLNRIWWLVPTDHSWQLVVQRFSTTGCDGGPEARVFILHFTMSGVTTWVCDFRSYESTTRTGTWRPVLTSPYWPGQDITIQFPP